MRRQLALWRRKKKKPEGETKPNEKLEGETRPKIFFLGPVCGKTAIIDRLSGSEISDKPSTVSMAWCPTRLCADNVVADVMLTDTGAHLRRWPTVPLLPRADVVVLAYDITSQESLETVEFWLRKVRDFYKMDAPVIVVGNKCDLAAQREVTAETGHEFARQHNIEFLEVSAKDGTNIKALESLLARKVYERWSRTNNPFMDKWITRIQGDATPMNGNTQQQHVNAEEEGSPDQVTDEPPQQPICADEGAQDQNPAAQESRSCPFPQSSLKLVLQERWYRVKCQDLMKLRLFSENTDLFTHGTYIIESMVSEESFDAFLAKLYGDTDFSVTETNYHDLSLLAAEFGFLELEDALHCFRMPGAAPPEEPAHRREDAIKRELSLHRQVLAQQDGVIRELRQEVRELRELIAVLLQPE